MKKNVAGQTVGAQLISKTDGSAVTSGATEVYITGDAGTQTASSGSPSGAVHEGNGYWSFMPTQAETNYDHVAFTFVNTSAVNVTVQIYTSFPQTGDNYARIGAPAGASVSADVAALKTGQDSVKAVTDKLGDTLEVAGGSPANYRFSAAALSQAAAVPIAALQADTDDIQARLPAALVGGRMDVSVGAMAANVITATAINADAITDAKVASDVTIASVTGSVGSIATGGISAASFAAGAIDNAAIATDAIGSAELAASAITEIQAGLSTLDAAGIRTAVGLASANLDTQIGTLATAANLATVAGYVDTEVAAIKAKTDNLPSDPADASDIAALFAATDAIVTPIRTVTDKLGDTLEAGGSPANYRFSAAALALAPTGGSAPTATAIADEVQTRTIAAVTLVNGLAANTVTASALASDAVTEIQNGLATASAVSTLQTSVDDLPTNAELATALGTADDAVLAQVALVKAKTDNLPSDPADASDIAALFTATNAIVTPIRTVTDKLGDMTEAGGSPANYRFSAAALVQAPTGSGASAASIADAVWDEAIADHLTLGTTGKSLNSATAAGDPWASVIEGSYTAQDLLRILAAVAAGKTVVVAPGNGTAAITFRDISDASDIVVANTVGSERTSVTLAP